MASIFRNILDAMKFSEEDEDYDDYVNEMQERQERESVKSERVVSAQPKAARSYKEDYSSANAEAPAGRGFQAEEKRPRYSSEKGKVVQFRGNVKELGLCVVKPTAFSDCQDISDMLVNGSAIVINLEGFDDDIAQRIMDFVSGTVYAINGKLHPIAKRIYIVSPETVNITGDVLNIVSQGGVEAPTISRDF